jgi:hypothetical protein
MMHHSNKTVVRGWTEWEHIDPSERNCIGSQVDSDLSRSVENRRRT